MSEIFRLTAPASMQRYLCIVTASWQDPEGGQKTGIFAQTLIMDVGTPLESVAQLTIGLMQSSGLPLSPAHVVVVKNDLVVANWMSDRDFVSSDLWDTVQELLRKMRGSAQRRETLA